MQSLWRVQASFAVTIVSEAETVLFNTELVSIQGAEHVFAPTPPMSTYLVGIVVGELEKNEMMVKVAGGAEGSDDYDSGGERSLPVTVYNRIGYGGYVDLAKHSAAAAVQGAIWGLPSSPCARTATETPCVCTPLRRDDE